MKTIAAARAALAEQRALLPETTPWPEVFDEAVAVTVAAAVVAGMNVAYEEAEQRLAKLRETKPTVRQPPQDGYA